MILVGGTHHIGQEDGIDIQKKRVREKTKPIIIISLFSVM